VGGFGPLDLFTLTIRRNFSLVLLIFANWYVFSVFGVGLVFCTGQIFWVSIFLSSLLFVSLFFPPLRIRVDGLPPSFSLSPFLWAGVRVSRSGEDILSFLVLGLFVGQGSVGFLLGVFWGWLPGASISPGVGG